MAHNFLCHGLAGLFCEVLPTALVDIATGTVGELVTEYMTADGRRNSIIVQAYVNGSVQFIGIPDVWGSSLRYV